MTNQASSSDSTTVLESSAMLSADESAFETRFKAGIWSLGNACWLFGITDRSIAAFSDGYLSATDVTQLFTASFFFAAWLFLKPNWKALNRNSSK